MRRISMFGTPTRYHPGGGRMMSERFDKLNRDERRRETDAAPEQRDDRHDRAPRIAKDRQGSPRLWPFSARRKPGAPPGQASARNA
jgi:hypothetical protein